MEPIESSETSAYNNTVTPGTYPKDSEMLAVEVKGRNPKYNWEVVGLLGHITGLSLVFQYMQ